MNSPAITEDIIQLADRIYTLTDCKFDYVATAVEIQELLAAAMAPQDGLRAALETTFNALQEAEAATCSAAYMEQAKPPFKASEMTARHDRVRSALAVAQKALSATPAAQQAAHPSRLFSLGQRVTKTKGSSWTGKIVGFYLTELTLGYAVESDTEKGSVQIYPESALSAYQAAPASENREPIQNDPLDFRGRPHLCEFQAPAVQSDSDLARAISNQCVNFDYRGGADLKPAFDTEKAVALIAQHIQARTKPLVAALEMAETEMRYAGFAKDNTENVGQKPAYEAVVKAIKQEKGE